MQQASQPTMSQRRQRMSARSAATGAQQGSSSIPRPTDEQLMNGDADDELPRSNFGPKSAPNTPPPSSGPRSRRGTGSTNTQSHSQQAKQDAAPHGQTEYSIPSDVLHMPAATGFFLGGIGILMWISANIWQIVTSIIAFTIQFFTGKIYLSMGASARAQAYPIIMIVCIVLAVAFQIGVLYLAFRVQNTFVKESEGRANKLDTLRSTAITMASNADLLLIFGLISFVMDTVGDYYFVTTYTDSIFLLFAYGSALYATSTIVGQYAMAYVQHGMIAYQWYRKLQLDNAIKAEKVGK